MSAGQRAQGGDLSRSVCSTSKLKTAGFICIKPPGTAAQARIRRFAGLLSASATANKAAVSFSERCLGPRMASRGRNCFQLQSLIIAGKGNSHGVQPCRGASLGRAAVIAWSTSGGRQLNWPGATRRSASNS